MNLKTIEKFLTGTDFKRLDYRAYSYGSNLHKYEGFYFVTNDESGTNTLLIALRKGIFSGKIIVYKNDEFVVRFDTLFGKWSLKSLIKQAFSKHFDKVIENWNKKK